MTTRRWAGIGLFVALGAAAACSGSSSGNTTGGTGGTAGPSTGGSSGKGASGGAASGGKGGTGAAGGSGKAGGGGTAGSGGTAGKGGSAGKSGGAGKGGTSGESGGGGEGVTGGLVCAEDIGSNVVITTDAELVAFANQHCEVLEGTLTIQSTALTDLDALAPSTLRIIRGNLEITQNTALENIEGLAGLVQVDGQLVLSGNVALENLDGLETLTHVGTESVKTNLLVAQNQALTSVAALSGAIIDAGLVVTDNAVLPNISGIDHLVTASSITVVNNPSLVELGTGLGELEECDGLTIVGNATMETLELPALVRSQALSITSHPLLESISLPSLTTVDSSLSITQNDVLADLGDLDALMTVGALTIVSNHSLAQCLVDELDARLMACTACTDNDPDGTCN
jgi:hypothetical protein